MNSHTSFKQEPQHRLTRCQLGLRNWDSGACGSSPRWKTNLDERRFHSWYKKELSPWEGPALTEIPGVNVLVCVQAEREDFWLSTLVQVYTKHNLFNDWKTWEESVARQAVPPGHCAATELCNGSRRLVTLYSWDLFHNPLRKHSLRKGLSLMQAPRYCSNSDLLCRFYGSLIQITVKPHSWLWFKIDTGITIQQ